MAGISTRSQVLSIQVLTVFALVGFLFVAHRFYSFLPTPAAVGAASLGLLATAEFYRHLAITLYEAVAGLAIATVLGIGVGIAIGANRLAHDFFNPIILALYSVPKIVFLPILLMIFGTGFPPKIANAALHAFFPIVLNSLVGMREVSRLHIKTGRSMRASPWQIVRTVYLPSMVLPVVAGIRLGFGLSFLGALLAELFESTEGTGHYVMEFYAQAEIPQMFVVIIAVFCLILAVNAAMKGVEQRLTRWRRA